MTGAQEQTSEVTELRWLHELRMRDYGRAAASLARVAAAARGGPPQCARSGRAACLTKLALLAGEPGGLSAPSRQVPSSSMLITLSRLLLPHGYF